MRFTAKGQELYERYGYRFDVVYRPTCKASAKRVGKISAKRAKRIIALYLAIQTEGEVNERDFPFDYIPEYRNISRNTLLHDLHLLERLGLIACDLVYPGERVPYSDAFVAENRK